MLLSVKSYPNHSISTDIPKLKVCISVSKKTDKLVKVHFERKKSQALRSSRSEFKSPFSRCETSSIPED